VHTVGLSNAAFSDRTWNKVLLGEELMLNTIRHNIENDESEDQLIHRFLDLLSHETLPREGKPDGAGLEAYIPDLRHSIYVPTIGRREMHLPDDEVAAARLHEKVDVVGFNTPVRNNSPSVNPSKKARQLGVTGLYGTQKQTVILADKDFNVRFFERTLFNEDSNAIPPGQGDIDVRFTIEKS